MVEGESTKPIQKSRSRLIGSVVLIGLFVVVTIVGGKWYRDHKMRRFNEFAGYSNAYALACCINGLRNPTLAQVENEFNEAKAGKGNIDRLPIYPSYPRPTYRPVASESDQTFLIFIETKQPGVWLQYRFAIFGKPDGMDMRVEWMTDGEIKTAIKDDDQKRQGFNASSTD